jgi:hypothetical protein
MRKRSAIYILLGANKTLFVTREPIKFVDGPLTGSYPETGFGET